MPTVISVSSNYADAPYRLSHYIQQIVSVSVEAGEHLSQKQLDEVRAVGRAVALTLTRALKGAAIALAEAPTGKECSWAPSAIGWIFHHVAEILEMIPVIEDALDQARGGAIWPLEEVLQGPMTLSKVIWLLPCAALSEITHNHDKRVHRFLSDACECYLETETLTLQEYSEMLAAAISTGEISEHAASAVSLISEWSGFLAELQQIHIMIQNRAHHLAQAA